jgi:excisionase family DNA binding protein
MAVSSRQGKQGYAKISAISKYAGESPSTIRRRLKSGELPYYRLPSGTILIAYADVDEWLSKFRVERGRDPTDELLAEIMSGLEEN